MKTAKSNNRNAASKRLQFWALPILVVLAALAVFLVLRFMNRENEVTLEESVYQFSRDRRLDYDAGTAMLQGKYSIILRTENREETDGDATPLYAAQEEVRALYLTRNVSWTDPFTGQEWSIPMFTRLAQADGALVDLELNGKTIRLEGGIGNDCAGTYVFLDYGSVLLNGKTVAVTPFSFCSTAGGSVRIYNYENDDLYTTDRRATNLVFAADRGYQVDLTTGIFTDEQGNYRLLVASPKLLPSIEKH